jgi:hypothetical protein
VSLSNQRTNVISVVNKKENFSAQRSTISAAEMFVELLVERDIIIRSDA